MIVLVLVLLALLALGVDLYLYRSVCGKWRLKTLRVAYVVLALVVDLSLVVSMSFYSTLTVNPLFMSFVMWVIFAFLTLFGVKIVYAIFLLLSQLLHKCFKRYSFRFMRKIGLMLSFTVACVMLYGSTFGRLSLRVENVEIYSDKIPPAFDGYKVALFSDAHIGNMGRNNLIITDLVETINEIQPDIVVQCGDLVNILSDELTAEYMATLSRIEAPVYSVLGNHDLAYYISDTTANRPSEVLDNLIEKQRVMGWDLLQNEGRWLRRNQDSIALCGVSYPNNIGHNGYNSAKGGSNAGRAMQDVESDNFSILISHSPSLFDSTSLTILPDLILSGHVHSMQMKIGIGDWQWSPAKFLYPMFSGLYTKDGRNLYINDGLGYVLYPVRIGTRPELTIFTLKHGTR